MRVAVRGHSPTLDAARPLSDAFNAATVVAAFAVGQAIQINNGMFHPAAIAWIGVAVVALAAAISPAIRERCVPSRGVAALLFGCVTIQFVQLIVWDLRWGTGSALTIAFLVVAAGAAAVAFARPVWWGLSLVLLLCAHFGAGAMSIRDMPEPIIDVWHFQQGSTAALLEGREPYGVRFRDVYGRDLGFYGPGASVDGWLTYSYPYPPLTLILTAPSRLLGDVRWAHLLALEAAALLLVAAARDKRRAVLGVAMLLFTPRALLVIKAAWTEPLVILALAAVVYCAARAPRRLWLALGMLLAIKQYTIVALPLALLLMPRREVAATLFKAAAVAIGVTLPFLLWNPESFVRSVVLWQFRQPFRTDSLSYAVILAHWLGVQPGVWLSLLSAGAATWLAWRGAPRNAHGFAAAFALVMLALFATSKQAFCNYYFLVIGAACAAVAVSEAKREVSDAVLTTNVSERALSRAA
jgi:hypothetical protein